MLRPHVLVLGVCIFVAGCAGPRTSTEPAPAEECLLGGPPRAPSENRTAFNLTSEHLEDHPTLERVFSRPSHILKIPCGEGLELMNHLAAEGADVAEGAKTYDRNVFLTYNGTTLWVPLQAQR